MSKLPVIEVANVKADLDGADDKFSNSECREVGRLVADQHIQEAIAPEFVKLESGILYARFSKSYAATSGVLDAGNGRIVSSDVFGCLQEPFGTAGDKRRYRGTISQISGMATIGGPNANQTINNLTLKLNLRRPDGEGVLLETLDMRAFPQTAGRLFMYMGFSGDYNSNMIRNLTNDMEYTSTGAGTPTRSVKSWCFTELTGNIHTSMSALNVTWTGVYSIPGNTLSHKAMMEAHFQRLCASKKLLSFT